MRIGVLALQGAFREHLETLSLIGVEGVRVREPADLAGVSGLILPGGESTTMRQLIDRWGLRQPILDLAERGAPIFGTCAGMIVLARDIAGGEAPILPLLDVTVERNAFGRQLDSFEADVQVDVLGTTPVHAVFIRAPVIERTGPDVDILARLDDGRIVAVRERNIIATAFHPHKPRYLLLLCLRGDPEARTLLCSVDDVLPHLDDETIAILRQARFRTRPDESFLEPGTIGELGAPLAVLDGDEFTYDEDLMVGIDDEIFVIASGGIVIRTSVREISSQGRDATGVRVMNLEPGQSVAAVAPVLQTDEA